MGKWDHIPPEEFIEFANSSQLRSGESHDDWVARNQAAERDLLAKYPPPAEATTPPEPAGDQ